MEKILKNKILLIFLFLVFLIFCDFNIQKKEIEKYEKRKKEVKEYSYKENEYEINKKIIPVLKNKKTIYKNLFNCAYLPKIYIFEISEYVNQKIINIDFKDGSKLFLKRNDLDTEYEIYNITSDTSSLDYFENRVLSKYEFIFFDEMSLKKYDEINYTKKYTLKNNREVLGSESYTRNLNGDYEVEYIHYEYSDYKITRTKDKSELVRFNPDTRKIKEILYCVYQSASSRNKKTIYKEIDNEIKEMEHYNEFGNYLYTENL